MGRSAVKVTGPESAAVSNFKSMARITTPRLDHDRCRTGVRSVPDRMEKRSDGRRR